MLEKVVITLNEETLIAAASKHIPKEFEKINDEYYEIEEIKNTSHEKWHGISITVVKSNETF